MARTVNISVWAISLVVSSPTVIFATADPAPLHESHEITCNLDWPKNVSRTMGEAWVIYTFTLGFAVPLIIIVTCYSLMTRRLCDSVKGTSVQRNQSRRHREKAIKKVERLVAVVVTVFVICWLPFYIFQIANLFHTFDMWDLETVAGLFYFTIALSYSNSCCNPVLYAFFDENFKKSFQEALKIRPKIRFTKHLAPSNAYNTFYSRRTELVTMTVKSTVPMTTGDTRMDTLKLPNCVPTPEMSKHLGQEQAGPTGRKHVQQLT
ncbi:Somatostatin receptor type 5 [Branchiostoma belcheri]|nr:Somatostatin receptor type 5 [Branchiostoma belcheri]